MAELVKEDDAAAIGVDRTAFDACMADPKSLEAIKSDIAEGRRLGVRGTPNFFINGKAYRGGKRAEDLLRLVDKAAAAE